MCFLQKIWERHRLIIQTFIGTVNSSFRSKHKANNPFPQYIGGLEGLGPLWFILVRGSAVTNGKSSPIEIFQPGISHLGHHALSATIHDRSEMSDPLNHQFLPLSNYKCMRYHSVCETLVVTRLHPTAQKIILVSCPAPSHHIQR